PVAPAPTSAGLLGMARITGTPGPHHFSSASSLIPAATDITNGRVLWNRGCNGVRTAPATCGLTATTTRVAGAIAAALAAVAVLQKPAARALEAAGELSPTQMCSGGVPRRSRPPISARPMLPPPRNAICCLLLIVQRIVGFSGEQRRYIDGAATPSMRRPRS